MTATAPDLAKAREIAPCSCGGFRSPKMVANDWHLAECPARLIDDIAAALAEARLEGMRECAEIAAATQRRIGPHSLWNIAGDIELRIAEIGQGLA